MSNPQVSTQESADSLRKRVCKACDRCRLKKSKCDGSNPCSRCKQDNAICVFGERKKSHDKVYPKGYVEMLEQQQSQLVAGLQETYRRLLSADLWPGQALNEAEGNPLTHDILARLDIINAHGSGDSDTFEEDCDRLQQRLISQGAQLTRRRGSISSESDHSHTQRRKRASSDDSHTPSPKSAKTQLHREAFAFDSAQSSPIIQSPASISANIHNSLKPSPLHHDSPLEDNVQPIDSEDTLPSWQDFNFDGNMNSNNPARTQFAYSAPQPQDPLSAYDNWQGFDAQLQFEPSMMLPYPLQTPNGLSNTNPLDWPNEPMDLDFSKFIQAAAT